MPEMNRQIDGPRPAGRSELATSRGPAQNSSTARTRHKTFKTRGGPVGDSILFLQELSKSPPRRSGGCGKAFPRIDLIDKKRIFQSSVSSLLLRGGAFFKTSEWLVGNVRDVPGGPSTLFPRLRATRCPPFGHPTWEAPFTTESGSFWLACELHGARPVTPSIAQPKPLMGRVSPPAAFQQPRATAWRTPNHQEKAARLTGQIRKKALPQRKFLTAFSFTIPQQASAVGGIVEIGRTSPTLETKALPGESTEIAPAFPCFVFTTNQPGSHHPRFPFAATIAGAAKRPYEEGQRGRDHPGKERARQGCRPRRAQSVSSHGTMSTGRPSREFVEVRRPGARPRGELAGTWLLERMR